jgi:transposase InsO family protein
MEESKMVQRMKFVLRTKEKGVTIAEACREFNISRPTGYKWLERYEEEGPDGLNDRSRAPEHIPHKTDERLEEIICALRNQHPKLGPKKLRAWLSREHPGIDWPAPSTIGEILNRNGLIEERTRRRKTPPATDPLGEADAPNRIWSADFKGQFELQNGRMCFPLTVTDNYSRMILGCRALPSTKGEPVREYFERIFEQRGVPEAIRTDNGAPFASRSARGLSSLSAWWLSIGIDQERIEPREPQKNGRHERMHLTLKDYTARPAAAGMDAQQEAFEKFMTFFNHARPHEAHGQKVPASRYKNASREYSNQENSLSYPECDMERRVTVNGNMHFANTKIYVSKALCGYRVGLVEADVDVWVIRFANKDVGLFEPGDKSMEPLDKPESVRKEPLAATKV